MKNLGILTILAFATITAAAGPASADYTFNVTSKYFYGSTAKHVVYVDFDRQMFNWLGCECALDDETDWDNRYIVLSCVSKTYPNYFFDAVIIFLMSDPVDEERVGVGFFNDSYSIHGSLDLFYYNIL